MNLVPIPKLTALCVVHFESLVGSMEAMQSILECNPTAVELIDKTILDMAAAFIEIFTAYHFYTRRTCCVACC